MNSLVSEVLGFMAWVTGGSIVGLGFNSCRWLLFSFYQAGSKDMVSQSIAYMHICISTQGSHAYVEHAGEENALNMHRFAILWNHSKICICCCTTTGNNACGLRISTAKYA